MLLCPKVPLDLRITGLSLRVVGGGGGWLTLDAEGELRGNRGFPLGVGGRWLFGVCQGDFQPTPMPDYGIGIDDPFPDYDTEPVMVYANG